MNISLWVLTWWDTQVGDLIWLYYSHTSLLRKLASYGVRAGELRWFDNYLNRRRQRVCINGAQSCWTDILRGVSQGSILGLLLFTIYLNDLPQSVVHESMHCQ